MGGGICRPFGCLLLNRGEGVEMKNRMTNYVDLECGCQHYRHLLRSDCALEMNLEVEFAMKEKS